MIGSAVNSNVICTTVGKTWMKSLAIHFHWTWNHRHYGTILKLYLLTFLLVLPILCYKLPFSLYFMESLVPSREEVLPREQKEADMLAKEAWAYIEKQGNGKDYKQLMDAIGSNERRSSPSNATVFITVISINRKAVQGYLTRTVAKLHRLIKKFHEDTSRKNVFALALCNVDTWPVDNSELYKIAAALSLPIFERFAKPVRQLDDNEFGKEKDDYVFCLDESLRHDPKFVLLLEDDALPVDNMLQVIHRIVTYSYKRFSPQERSKIGYLKLFHPSRLLSFVSLESERIPQLVALGTVFGSMSLWIYIKCTPMTALQVLHSIRTIHQLWIAFIFYFMLLFLCIGYANILKFVRLSNFYQIVPAPSCCTPAMLFPNHSGHVIADYLRNTPWKAHPKDRIIELFLKETDFKGWMVSPNLVDHIGLYSSLWQEYLNPYYSN